MSKKTLLSESQVRQFMKLAKLAPLTPGFVEGLTESHGRGIGENPPHARLEEDEHADEEATERELGDMDDDVHDKDDEIDDLEADLDDADAELDGDGADQMISVGDLMTAMKVALEDVTGQPVEATVEDEEEVEVADVDMGDDLEVDADDMELDTDMEMDDMLEEDQGEEDRDDDAESARLGAISHDTGLKGSKKKKQKSRRDDVLGVRGTRTKKKKNESTEATDELVEQITKRVAARILKSALKKNSNVEEGMFDKVKSAVGLGKPKVDVMQLAKDANRKVSGGATAEEAAAAVAGGDEKLEGQVLQAMRQKSTQQF